MKSEKIKENFLRHDCKDVFNSFLVRNSNYSSIYDIPVIYPCFELPKKLVRFSDAMASDDYNCWIHFYEDDYKFERIWKNPNKYLPILKKYKGVIAPDFSLYRDMPFAMQIWNLYRSRALASWLQLNGINVIPNLRFGDERTFDLCCSGIFQESVISVGTIGIMKNRIDRETLLNGLDYIVRKINPSHIIICGSIPRSFVKKCIACNIKITHFQIVNRRQMKLDLGD